MKLYTEEEVRKLLNEILVLSSSVNDAIDSLTPVWLPTDEQIEEEFTIGNTSYPHMIDGAKWIRNKILNKNK